MSDPVEEMVRGLIADMEAADEVADAQAASAQKRIEGAWTEGYRTWTLAGPPPAPPESAKPS